MSANSTGADITMTAPNKAHKVMRFEVRDRPVNLLFAPAKNEVFRLAKIVSVIGNDVNTVLVRDEAGEAKLFGYSHITDYDVDRPGDYVLIFSGCNDPQSVITRREIGVQFMRCCP